MNRRTFLQTDQDGTLVPVTAGSRQFWKASGFFTRVHRMPWQGHLLVLRAAAQFTPDDLPPAEEFQIGGAFSVRGFTEGLLIGDQGYNASAEYRMPIPGLHYVSDWLSNRVQVAGFFDMGQAFTDRSNPAFNRGGHSTSRQRTLLMGTGVGLRARVTRFAIGFVDFGFPLSKQASIEPLSFPDMRVHFGLRSDLLDNSFKERGTEPTPVKQKAFLNRINAVANRVARQEAEDQSFWANQQRTLSEELDSDPYKEAMDAEFGNFSQNEALETEEVWLDGEKLSVADPAPPVVVEEATMRNETTSVVPEMVDNNTIEARPSQQNDPLDQALKIIKNRPQKAGFLP